MLEGDLLSLVKGGVLDKLLDLVLLLRSVPPSRSSIQPIVGLDDEIDERNLSR